MAYETRRFIKHIDKYGVVHRLEIQQDGYGGSASSMNGNKGKGAFAFEHEDVADEEEFLKVYANPIQKGMLEVFPVIENATDFGLLEDIFESDEEEFRLVWKQDGSVFWTGYVLVDLLEFDEAPYPYTSTIVAKDFSRLKGMDYALDDTRQTWITTIADLLGHLNLGLNIETATSWINNNTTDSVDYLQQIYHETKALRNFGKTDEETDQPLAVWDALERVLSDNCLILKQIDGVYKIDQLTAYEDPANVLITTYDSSGSEVSSSTENKELSYDRNVRRVKSNGSKSKGSKSKGFVAIKRARATYDHRTKVTNIQPTSVHLEDSTGTETYSNSQLFLSDGSQRIDFNLGVLGSRDGDLPSSTGRYFLKAGSYYWDQANYEWTSGSIIWNEYELTNTTNKPGLTIWTGGVGVVTDHTPEDADGELRFRVDIPTGLTQADVTIRMDITNPIASENSTSIDYELTQTAGFSEDYQHADTWYGDGPVQWSVGALRHGTANNNTTTDDWNRRGLSTSDRNYHANVLKEIVDIQRTWVRRLEAVMYGSYDPTGMLQYRSGNYYYIGGSFDGASGDWNVRLMDVNVQEDASDDFDDIPKFSGDTDSQTGASSNDPTTGDFNPSTYDKRWFNIQNDLSEGTPSTMRSNLGLVIGTDVQAWDATLQDLSDNLTATASELNRLDGDLATVQGNLGLKDGSAALDLASLDVDDINIDGNTIQAQNGQNLVLDGNGNDVLVNGDTIKIDKEMTTTDNIIVLNDGEVGSGITAGEAGAQFDRGTETDYQILFQESNGLFSIGEVGDLQPVLTREVSPDADGLFYFDDADNRAVTSSDLTFAGGVLGVPEIETEGVVTLEGDGNESLHQFRSNWDSGDYFAQNVAGTPSNPEIRLRWWDDSASSYTDILYYHHNALVELFGDLRSDHFSSGSDGWQISHAGAMELSDTLTGVDASLSSTLEVDGVSTFGDDIQTDNFSSGFTGEGLQATHSGQLTVGDIIARGSAHFRELIFDQLGAVGGSNLTSSARGKIESVDEGNSEITLDDPNERGLTTFAVDDIFWVMAWDIDGAEIVSAEGTVTSITNTTLTLSFDSGAIGDLSAGDVIVQRGNTTDASRQSLIYQTASDADAPFTAYYQNVDAVSDFAPSNVFAQIGVLDNLNAEHGVSGDGVFVSRGRFTDDILVGSMDKTGTYFEVDGGDLNAVLDTFDVTIDSSNAITADATGLDISAETFDLSATNILIDSANDRAKFGGASKFIDWNSGSLDAVMDSLDITIDGSNSIVADATGVDITAETFLLSTTDLTINSATPRIDVGSSHFLDGSTDMVSFSGGVLTADGSASEVGLAGFTADSDSIDAVIGSNELNIRSDNDGLPLIRLHDGAANHTIFIGQMWDADSDSYISEMGLAYYAGGITNPDNLAFRVSPSQNQLAGLDFNSGALVTGDGDLSSGYTAGTVTGMQPRASPTTRVLFAGADDEDGASASGDVFYAQADGNISHPAVGSIIWNPFTQADFGNVFLANEAEDIDNFTVRTGDVSENSTESLAPRVANTTFMRKFSEDKLVLYSRIIINNSGSGTFTNEVEINVYNLSSQVASITESYSPVGSGDPIQLELDISELTTSSTLRVEVLVRAGITTGSGESGEAITELFGISTLRTETS